MEAFPSRTPTTLKAGGTEGASSTTGAHSTLKGLYPGYFALVMATEIVSTALHLYHQTAISMGLMWIGAAAYGVLWVTYVLRAARFTEETRQDVTNPARMFGYFTMVAASNVLAVRFLFAHRPFLGLALGVTGCLLWIVLFYSLTTLLIVGRRVRLTMVNGGWLIAIVAEESLSTWLGAMVDHLPHAGKALFLAALVFWAMGIMLYVVFIGLVMDRLFFYRVRAADLDPPYWINMGATAITVLASSRLLLLHHAGAALVTVRPFLEGLTVVLWAWGSWWIPLLLVLGWWKYGHEHEPIGYHPAQWSIVFPLGMYATATTTLSRVPGFSGLHPIGAAFVWIALLAWAAVSIMAVRNVWLTRRGMRLRARENVRRGASPSDGVG